jgi:hypothetical protein
LSVINCCEILRLACEAGYRCRITIHFMIMVTGPHASLDLIEIEWSLINQLRPLAIASNPDRASWDAGTLNSAM